MSKRTIIADILPDPNGKNHTAFVKRGSNGHAKILLRKTEADPAPDPTNPLDSEDSMSTKNLQKIALMSEGARHYFGGLEDETVATAFLAKSADEQEAEVEAAKVAKMSPDEKAKYEADKAEAIAKAKAEEEAKQKPTTTTVEKSAEVLALEQQLAEAQGTIETVTKRLDERDTAEAVAAIKKRAKDEFSAVPDAEKILTSIAKMSAEDQAPHIAGLVQRQALLKKIGTTVHGDDAAAEGSAAAELNTKVEEVAKTRNISKSAAYLEVTGDPKNADLVNRVRDEERVPA